MKRIVCGLAGLMACGAVAVSAAPAAQPDAASMQQGMEALMKAMGGAQGGGAAALVDFRELKALLPADVGGLKRKSASGEKNGAMGMSVAQAEGRYADKDDQSSITIKLSDLGGLGGLGAMAHAGWAMQEIDKETDSGYERTFTHEGQKALEKYDTGSKSGEIQVMVGGRFMVEINGNDVKPEVLKAALKGIDLKKLAALKPAAGGK